MERHRFPVRLAQAIVVLSAAAVAGCFNGGGTTTTAVPPVVSPTVQPFSSSTTVPVQTSGGTTTYTGPNGGGFSSQLAANLSTPAPGTSATVTITVSASPPAGVPPLNLARVSAQSGTRSPLSQPTPAGAVVLFYEQYTTSQNTTETGDPIFTIGLPSQYPTTGVDYYLAILQGSTWQFGYAPGVYNTGFQTLTLTGSYPLTFTANSPQNFALYYQPATDPTPTPPPSPTPTTAPTGTVGVGLN
jgi:hypothetical protein